jgi:hypothetical protein
MQAGLEGVWATTPAHRKAPSHVVHFHDLDVIATFQRLYGGAEPGNSATNNDDLPPVVIHRKSSARLCLSPVDV